MNGFGVCVFFSVFLLVSSLFVSGWVGVQAETGVETSVSISFYRSTIYLDEDVSITIAVKPAPPSPDCVFQGLNVSVTWPNGTIHILGSLDNFNGTARLFLKRVLGEHLLDRDSPGLPEYELDQVGNYTFTASIPGQFFANGTIYYQPATSPPTTLTVIPPESGPHLFTPEEEGSWETRLAYLREARSGLGVSSVCGKIYAIGGTTVSGSMPGGAVLGIKMDGTFLGGREAVGTNREYDPAMNTWTRKASMPTPRFMFDTAVYQDKIYCVGGIGREGYTGVVEVYDPATDTWETRTPMPEPRAWLCAEAVDDKIYVVGGRTEEKWTELFWVYDPATDSWSTEKPIPILGIGQAVALDHKLYFFGGHSESRYQGHVLNQIYDTKTGTWSTGSKLPSGSGGMCGAGVTTGVWAPQLIYVVCSGRVLVYDPETDRWAFGADIPTKRYAFGVAVAKDMIYAIGGYTYEWPFGDFEPLRVNERYTPIGYGTVPPKISIFYPENRTHPISNIPLTFTVNKPVDWMGYSLDNQENVTITGNTTLSGLSEGTHRLILYAEDLLNNTGVSDPVYFTVDSTPPTINLLSPTNRTYSEVAVWLNFTVSEPVEWMGYSLNGQNNFTVSGNTTLAGLSEGTNKVKVYANDTAGNMASSTSVHFTVEGSNPPPSDVDLVPVLLVVGLSVVAVTVLLGAAIYTGRRKR